MNKQRRNIIGTMAMVVIAWSFAISSAGSLAAQDRPNIDAIVRQFHLNYSNNEVEKNGALDDDSLVAHLNGGADDEIKGIKWTVLQKAALATMPGMEEIIGIAEIAPGTAAERHTHTEYEFGYVLQGELVLENEGEAPRTVRTGDSYAIPAGKIHRGKNNGRGPLKVLAIYIVEQGKPLAMPANSAGVTEKTRPDIAALVRQFHSNYSKGEVEKNGELVDDNVIVDVNGGADNKVNGITYKGRKEFVAFLKKDKVMFADGKITHHDLIVSGNMGAVRFTMEGTHTGPIAMPNGVLPATGRKVRLEVTEFFTFNSSGKLVHVHTLYNTIGLIMQLTAK